MSHLSSRLTFTINNPAHSAESKLVALQKSVLWVGHQQATRLMPLTLLRQIKWKLLSKTGHFYLIKKICVPQGKKAVKIWTGNNYAKFWDLILVHLLGRWTTFNTYW